MVDANCAWSAAFAIEMGRAMEPYGLDWLEEPVSTDDIDGSAQVAAALATPVAGYETERIGLRDLIVRNAVYVVQPNSGWTGGLSEGRRIAALGQAHHKMVTPHAFGGAVLLAASLHFAASTPSALVMEFDQNDNGLRDELLKEPIRIQTDGTIRLRNNRAWALSWIAGRWSGIGSGKLAADWPGGSSNSRGRPPRYDIPDRSPNGLLPEPATAQISH